MKIVQNCFLLSRLLKINENAVLILMNILHLINSSKRENIVCLRSYLKRNEIYV